MAWHAAELATTSANAAAAILIMVIVAGHNSDRAHQKKSPAGKPRGFGKFIGPGLSLSRPDLRTCPRAGGGSVT